MKTDGFIDSDPRRDLARQWVTSQMPGLGRQGWWPNLDSLRPASSDASFRRYFRIDGQAPREGDSTRQDPSSNGGVILWPQVQVLVGQAEKQTLISNGEGFLSFENYFK